MRRALLALLIVATVGPAPVAAAADSSGTEFWLGFPAAEEPFTEPPFAYRLMITASTSASGVVSVPGTAFSESFTVAPGSVTSVELPGSVELKAADAVTSGKGIHVTASQSISIQALLEVEGLSDGYLGLPTELLGTAYRVLDYPGNPSCGEAEFEIVGTQAATTVTIDSSVAIGSHPANTPYKILLGAGDAYLGQAAGTASTGGTAITADKPVAVFGGNSCGQVPIGTAAANYLVEQLPPIAAWGTDFSLLPFAGRTSGDQVTVIGSADETSLSVAAASGPVAGAPSALGAGQQATFAIDESIRVVADKPILVAHFAKGGESDSLSPAGDPTMILVPPRERWSYSQTVSTPTSGFSQRYLNVTIATADLGSLSLDGVPVAATSFAPVGGDPAVSGGRLAIEGGIHTLAAAGPFGVEVYGFDPYDAFGWPGAWGDGSRAPLPPVLPGVAPAPGPIVTVAPRCRVPKLRRKKLAAVQKALRRSNCRLGRVKKRKGATARTGRVVKQKPAAGKSLPAGAKVAVTLGAG